MKPSPDTRSPVVTFRNVSFSYQRRLVLENVSFQIPDRSFTTIVGPNGGGKTTLIKLMLGLLRPLTGTIRVLGGDPMAVRDRIGYMPQHAHYDVMFPVRVLDVVLMGTLKKGMRHFFGTAHRREKALAALEEVGIRDLWNRPFAALSGGQQRRVLIARSLVSDPDLLLMDEPTANVDKATEAGFYDLLAHFSHRITVILVTHDLGFVSRYVDHVVCVNKRVAIHPTSEITGEIIQEMYGRDLRMVRHDHEHPNPPEVSHD